ncbi:MAG: ATP-binding protein [Ornithinibacter sp.]
MGGTNPEAWLYLPSELAAVGAARRQVNALLSTLPPEQLDDAILATSEVVTNAVLHGEGPVRVRAWTGPHGVRVEVGDAGGGTLRPGTAVGNDEDAGRGLFIVGAITTRWGALPAVPGPGKTVWFEIDEAVP